LALASAHGPRLGFIATFQPDDEESRQKVEAAREERGSSFLTVEEPLHLTKAFSAQSPHCDAVVIDDLTIWISNQVMAGASDAEIEEQATSLTAAALQGPAEAIIVTSDVDFGFPMDSEPSRRFRRLAGVINRRMVESSSRLYWMVFGVPKRII
jgi:adenosylcobinamide kinase/adenosylcobinamide-phosphate guanylyltransferase